MTDRERFLAALLAGRMDRGDAIIVLAGEDGYPRMSVAVELFQREAAPFLVLSGGVSAPDKLDARELQKLTFGKGINHERVIADMAPQNTREQAVAVVKMAQERAWKRLLLACSPYHAPRAYLTFIKALQEVGCEDVCVLRVPTEASGGFPWFDAPTNAHKPRLDLLDVELKKITKYKAHCASYVEGLAYLARWEDK